MLNISGFPLVSVIVPVLNGEKYIGKCLNHLLMQDYPAGRFEIIVVDNGSSDGTAEIINMYPVKKTRCYTRGPSAARNAGIRLSNGEILIFIDADCLAQKHFIINHVAAHVKQRKINPDLRVVGGGIAGYNRNFWSLCDDFCSWSLYHPRLPRRWEERLCPTANISVHKSLFYEIGGFREDMLYGEDYAFCNLALKSGFKIYFEPGASVQHINRTSFKEYIYHARKWAEADLQLYEAGVLTIKSNFFHFIGYFILFLGWINMQPLYSGLLVKRFYVFFLYPFILINRTYTWYIRLRIHISESARLKKVNPVLHEKLNNFFVIWICYILLKNN